MAKYNAKNEPVTRRCAVDLEAVTQPREWPEVGYDIGAFPRDYELSLEPSDSEFASLVENLSASEMGGSPAFWRKGANSASHAGRLKWRPSMMASIIESPRMRSQPEPTRGTNTPVAPPSDAGIVTAGRPSQSMNFGSERKLGVLRTTASVCPEASSVQGKHRKTPSTIVLRRFWTTQARSLSETFEPSKESPMSKDSGVGKTVREIRRAAREAL